MFAGQPPERLSFAERANFLVTNRIPRRWLTLAIGRYSRIENPMVRSLSIAVWRLFADDLRLFEAKKRSFRSLHDCFIRELKDGARPLDTSETSIVSPCDAVVGEFGDANGLQVIQAKGFPYTLDDLLADSALAERHRNGRFVTLRLKSSMYHRFHAPCDGSIDSINYVSGDTWNVNPIALKVVERLFCKNERAVLPLQNGRGETVTLVAVAAILVASMRIHGLDVPLNLKYRGPNRIALGADYRKGDEIGYFEHGSTIVLFAPRNYEFVEGLASGSVIRMGQPILRRKTGVTALTHD